MLIAPRSAPCPSRLCSWSAGLFALVAAVGCGAEHDGPPVDVAGDDAQNAQSDALADATLPEVITLTLETRSGVGSLGWSFAEGALVPAEAADLTLSSFDCGARGRWVTLDGHGTEFCQVGSSPESADAHTCTSWGGLEIGGSSSNIEIGEELIIMGDDEVLARVVLQARTETPSDWYLQEPIEPFQVVLEVLPADEPAHPTPVRCRVAE